MSKKTEAELTTEEYHAIDFLRGLTESAYTGKWVKLKTATLISLIERLLAENAGQAKELKRLQVDEERERGRAFRPRGAGEIALACAKEFQLGRGADFEAWKAQPKEHRNDALDEVVDIFKRVLLSPQGAPKLSDACPECSKYVGYCPACHRDLSGLLDGEALRDQNNASVGLPLPPSDAEIEAAAQAIADSFADDYHARFPNMGAGMNTGKEDWINQAKAAVAASRRLRGEKE